MAESLAHTKWMCKYHIVFTPKYRRKLIYNQFRADIQQNIRNLCKWNGVEIIEGHMIARPYTFVVINTTEDEHLKFHGLSQREKCNDDI
ncbi:hypothetical protein SDC9_134095 [bioreactor metagenome]|uniref:Transposase IS200-like domain-containing protein n=1 Tax=bioreactor metagenome TaxID=1076179 RepID=A0A645DEJ1_9ZZZZ